MQHWHPHHDSSPEKRSDAGENSDEMSPLKRFRPSRRRRLLAYGGAFLAAAGLTGAVAGSIVSNKQTKLLTRADTVEQTLLKPDVKDKPEHICKGSNIVVNGGVTVRKTPLAINKRLMVFGGNEEYVVPSNMELRIHRGVVQEVDGEEWIGFTGSQAVGKPDLKNVKPAENMEEMYAYVNLTQLRQQRDNHGIDRINEYRLGEKPGDISCSLAVNGLFYYGADMHQAARGTLAPAGTTEDVLNDFKANLAIR